MNPSIIGKLYTPIDNSYEFNLSDKLARSPYLAGTQIGHTPKLTTVQSEPFDLTIKSGVSGTYITITFVIVEYRNETFMTMFHERGLNFNKPKQSCI